MTTFRLDSEQGCLQFALHAHYGQVDKQGQPYFLHVARVGSSLWRLGPEYVCAGFLHDVAEDTSYTLEDIEGLGASVDVVRAVDSVTKTGSDRSLEAYEAAVRRAMDDPIGRWVKAADVSDNASRVGSVPWGPEQVRLASKYELAEQVIREYIPRYRVGVSLPPPERHLTPV